MAISLTRLDLNRANALRREPPRPPRLRQPGYEERFDDRGVLYDCFMAPDGLHAVCMGPPMLNLKRVVMPALKDAFRKGFLSPLRVRRLDRHTQVWVEPRTLNAAVDGSVFEQRALAVQPNHCDLFRGKRVLVTQSKDNELTWIRDWVTFHVANHGCEAVLIYDNASTRYGVEDLRDTLAPIEGLGAAVIVAWPYTFGPPAGPSRVWDSDFGQCGALEHARWRFLASAEAVVHADIDELVVTRGRESIFDLAARSKTGYLCYRGVTVENATVQNDGVGIRHAHYIHTHTPPRATAPKWAVAPRRCPARSQWCVHHVTGMTPDALSAGVRHRHFKAITTNWKGQRWKLERPGPRHRLDEELDGWLERIR